MGCAGITGQGTALSLSVDTTIAEIRSIQLPEWLSEAVDFSGIEDVDWMAWKPSDLADGGEFVAELFMDTTIAPVTLFAIQTATITFPIQVAGNATNATLTGSGWVRSIGFPNAAVNEPMVQAITFKFDGCTVVPAFTVETT